MLQSVLKLFYPVQCYSCEQELLGAETAICTSCRLQLPETHFHDYNDTAIQKVFYGRLTLKNATSLFYFEKKGPIQQLIHNLKYRGKEEISGFLGDWLGTALKRIESYRDIDVVVPVPMHKRKKRYRGYNQVTGFAKQLALHLECDYNDTVLMKTVHTKTQVFKKRFLRSESVLKAFDISDSKALAGKHILLVDDILTTGATIEACGIALQKIPNVTLSVATMAIAVS